MRSDRHALAAALGLPLTSPMGTEKLGGNTLAAQVMLQRTMNSPGTVVAAMEHVNIQFLVEAMGVPKASVPSWPGSTTTRST